MTRSRKLTLCISTIMLFVLTACSFGQSLPATQIPTIESTTQAPPTATATEQPTIVPPTNTPLPTETATETPTEAAVTPTVALPTPTIVRPTATAVSVPVGPETGFSCDIIAQKPSDDTEYRSGANFDIKWTIINNGTSRWRDNTVLKYQSGPKMSSVTKIVLPRLKPDETFDVLLDATATGKSGRQVMVWAVIGPNEDGDATYWMCYPYTRIIIK